MSYGKAVREEPRVPARELRHAIPQVYAGYEQLHDSALAPGALDAKTKELIALGSGSLGQEFLLPSTCLRRTSHRPVRRDTAGLAPAC